MTYGKNYLSRCENEACSAEIVKHPWNIAKVEIRLLNIVRILLSEQLFKGKYHFTDMKYFAERQSLQQTSSETQELSSCRGIHPTRDHGSAAVCLRLPQPFRLSQSWRAGAPLL